MMKERTYYPRTAAAKVKYLAAHYPCVLVLGGSAGGEVNDAAGTAAGGDELCDAG